MASAAGTVVAVRLFCPRARTVFFCGDDFWALDRLGVSFACAAAAVAAVLGLALPG